MRRPVFVSGGRWCIKMRAAAARTGNDAVALRAMRSRVQYNAALMTTDHPDLTPSDEPPPRRRRPRYSGTHPKRFEHRYKELNPTAHPGMHEHIRAQGRTPAGTHVPVLVDEVLAALRPQPGDVVADCTIGHGGHAREFISRIAPAGRLIGLDVDAVQLERTRAALAADGAADAVRVALHRSHFAGLGKVLTREGVDGCDLILADLGVSSMQIDDPARGFGYKHDGPLDMRMDDRLARTAADWLACLSEDELTACLSEWADEPNAARIAAGIVRRRAARPLTATRDLVDVVFEAVGLTRRAWRNRGSEQRGALHPAARTFQALRMLVNDELSGLEQFLRVVPYCLREGGRVGIISFHSGEDRRVERSFADGLESGTYAAAAETPIRPSPAEVVANPRSRSALLRWAKRAAP